MREVHPGGGRSPEVHLPARGLHSGWNAALLLTHGARITMSDALDRGLAAFARRRWAEAYEELAVADRKGLLEPAALEPYSVTAYIMDRPEESAELLGRAHQEYLERHDPVGAARCAFWLGFQLLMRGERARGGGWIVRAERLLDDCGQACEEQGFVLLPRGLRLLAEGDPEAAHETFVEAGRIGARFGSRDLTALSTLGRGQARVRAGDIEEGVALLDEAMAAVDAGGLGPVAIGTIYCAVIEVCQGICDVGRAKEWTAALSDWFASQPEMVPFRGECLVRRSEILRLTGEWPDALEEARRAGRLLSRPSAPRRVAGAAFYAQAELHRLRGEFADAEDAYREANRRGRTPQPGLALLRLAQGRIADAEAAIRQVEGAATPALQSNALSAFVEIMLAAHDVEAAAEAAVKLSDMARKLNAPLLRAQAAAALGAVRLEQGDARAALAELRSARTTWQELDAPYEAARTQLLLARACRALGDEDTAQMELDAAVEVLERLGAGADLTRARLDERGHGLTPRELEVLRRVASGATNRAIGQELFISERTVERHVSNILAKLRVPTRAAATAHAYRDGLV